METIKLKLIQKTSHSKWYRTTDDKYDVLGEDLNCTSKAARAAGAGPVWSWQPATEMQFKEGKLLWAEWSEGMRSFGTKARCLLDLEQHLYTPEHLRKVWRA